MFLANKIALAHALYHICMDCRDKEKDCFITKIAKCPFREGMCHKLTMRSWEMVIEDKLGENKDESSRSFADRETTGIY